MATALLLALTLSAWTPDVALGPIGSPAPSPWTSRPVTTGWNEDFLVAWSDGRFGATTVVITSRVLSDGGVVQPFGNLASSWGASNPSLASTATLGALVFEMEGDIYLRLISSNGTWLGPAQRISSGRCPSVAVNDLGGVITFENSELRAVRFAWDGSILDTTSVQLSTGSLSWATCSKASSAPGDSAFLVLWRDAGALKRVVIPFAGAPTTEATLETGMSVGRIEASPVGVDRWLVTAGWVNGTLAIFNSYSVGLTGVGATQTVLPVDSWLDLDTTACPPGVCMLARRDGMTSTELSLAVLPLDGGVMAFSAPAMARTNEWDVTGALTGDGMLIVNNASALVRATVSNSTTFMPGAELPLSLHPASQNLSSVGVGFDATLVAWIQPALDGADVFIRRFDVDGVPIDAAPVAVAGLTDSYDKIEVLTNGVGWLLVLQDSNRAAGSVMLVSSAGVVSAEAPIPFSDLYHLGAAAFGDELMISAKHYRGTEWDPVLLTLKADAGWQEHVCQATPDKEHYTDVAVTGSGARLVVWQDVGPSGNFVAGVRFDASGQALDPTGFPISPPNRTALEPQLASDGANGFIVIWMDYSHLYAQHVVGTNAGPVVQLTNGSTLTSHHLITPVPGGALVTYNDRRDGSIYAVSLFVDASGALQANPGELISATGYNAWPSVGLGHSGAWFGFSRADTTLNTMEGRLRRFVLEVPGATCAASWQCQSSRCDAGICEAPVVITQPDGGVGEDGGTTTDPRARLDWSVGPACSTGSGLLPLVFAGLLLLRRRRQSPNGN